MEVSRILRRAAALAIAGAAGLALSTSASASVVYDFAGATGNYQLTVTQVGTEFNYELTVNPWNAEALGLFIDLGDFDLGLDLQIDDAGDRAHPHLRIVRGGAQFS